MSDDVVALLCDLIRIDSVNPTLSPDGSGESEIAAFVARWATDAGLKVDLIEPTPGRPNVIVRGGRDDGGQRLLLCGHLDTVGTSGMTDPFEPRIDGDRIHGRGGYDMKAGLAAALVACRDAVRVGLAGEVIVAAVADEEHSSTGIQAVLPELSVDAAIVTEPTELTISLAHKGFVWTEIVIEGIAAHGSRPQLGIDAIMKTGPILVALDRLHRELSTHAHPDLGSGTLHASLISGGVEESTIPDRCVVTIERRTLPGETTLGIEAEIAEVLAVCRADDPDLVVTSRTTLARAPMSTEAEAPIVKTLSEASATILSTPSPIGAMSYWTDAAFISAAGISTVLYGPAGVGAHAESEWVSASSTVDCALVLTRVARTFCA